MIAQPGALALMFRLPCGFFVNNNRERPTMNRAERSFLVLDIETILDPELPLPQPLTEGSALPPAPFHQVVVVGVCLMDHTYTAQRFGILGEGKNEAGILTDIARFLEERRPDIVSWNGRGFDLPVMAARCLRHGIRFAHYYVTRDARFRFTPDGHFDVMDYLADFGAARPARLDTVSRLIGLPGKIGVDGKDVGPLIHAGKLAEVQAYCLGDVFQTAAVFLRLQLVRGALDAAHYRDAMGALLERAAADPRLTPVVNACNRKRLLLEG
jgi:predicted PolB exonuclease-like 3'-5' exonuclease